MLLCLSRGGTRCTRCAAPVRSPCWRRAVRRTQVRLVPLDTWSRSTDRISRQADRQPVLEPGRDPVRLTVLGSISAVVGPI